MRKLQIFLLVLIILGLGLLATQKYWLPGLVNYILVVEEEVFSKNDPSDAYGPLNATYTLRGQKITLQNGRYEKEIAPGSASKEVVQVFGEPVVGDLNGDGAPDAALFLTEQSGGSGTFFYIAEAIKLGSHYEGTNLMLLGDRIAPQNINIEEGRAVANFAERKPGEPLTTRPSVGKSVWVHLDQKTMQIGEWVRGFEGESNVEINFDEAGHIIQDNPGLKPGVWYLSYEKPGAPALTAELAFTGRSVCTMASQPGNCPDILLLSSALVRIQGVRDRNGVVEVIKAGN